MKAMITFDLPEEDAELKAALDGMEHIGAIRDFWERLRNLNKHGHKFETTEQALESLYHDYNDIMAGYL